MLIEGVRGGVRWVVMIGCDGEDMMEEVKPGLVMPVNGVLIGGVDRGC